VFEGYLSKIFTVFAQNLWKVSGSAFKYFLKRSLLSIIFWTSRLNALSLIIKSS